MFPNFWGSPAHVSLFVDKQLSALVPVWMSQSVNVGHQLPGLLGASCHPAAESAALKRPVVGASAGQLARSPAVQNPRSDSDATVVGRRDAGGGKGRRLRPRLLVANCFGRAMPSDGKMRA